MAKLGGDIRLRIANKTDNRISAMNEIISGIQVIKMHAWEVPFEKVVKEIRSSEVSDIQQVSYLRAIYTSFALFLERIALVLTITSFVLLGHHLTSDIAFSLTPLLNTLLLVLSYHLPTCLSIGAECLISIRRLRDFLMMEEREMTQIESIADGCIDTEYVNASWIVSTPTLENITLNIPSGTLCAVVGPVGSGKSSLLQVRFIHYIKIDTFML